MKKLVRVVVACLAIVFAIALTESADAQPQQRTPQQYRKGECIYQQGTNQLVGCYSTGSGRSWYYHVPWQAMQDQKTGFWVADRGGVLYILTQQGWHPMATHPQGKQLLAEMQAANQQQGQGQQGGGAIFNMPGLPGVEGGNPNLPGYKGVPGIPPSSGGAFITPDCQPQRGQDCGRYDGTPHGDKGTHRDQNTNARPQPTPPPNAPPKPYGR